MTAQEKRLKVREAYDRLIKQKNKYSQSLRNYAFKKYKDGKYYSDCSSSVSYAYKEAGFSFGILNTVGMYQCKKFTTVPVEIKKGIIQNAEVLRIGDMLLFAGKDSSRAYAGYVGHVEMVYSVGSTAADTVLVGHGSGNPAKHNCKTYCSGRYANKTGTKLGHRGLIKVVRFIQDDGSEGSGKGGFDTLSKGDSGSRVKAMQHNLFILRYDIGKYGEDGDFGKDTRAALKAFQTDAGLSASGVYDEKTDEALTKAVFEKYGATKVRILTTSVNVRTAPNTNAQILGTVKKGETLTYQGDTRDGWHLIVYENQNAWVSSRNGDYAELI